MIRLFFVHGERLGIDDAVDPPGYHVGLVPFRASCIIAFWRKEQFNRTFMIGTVFGDLNGLVPELPGFLGGCQQPGEDEV